MATIFFIAVQCCQCSTMQVKQKKKSSNKWSCVVCNQKQSVRQVFAQGSMAKDVRKYVQTFNMSRQLAEQNALPPPQPPEPEPINDGFPTNKKKKRTDWSEYVDSYEDVEIEHDDYISVDVFEPRVVTELPKLKAVFKKPKLMNNHVADFDSEDCEKPFRPVFGKRNAIANNKTVSLDKEPSTSMKNASKWSDCKRKAAQNLRNKGPLKSQQAPIATTGASKWSHCLSLEEETDEGPANKAAYGKESLRGKGVSQWNGFMTEDDRLLLESGRDFEDMGGRWNNNAAFETTMNEQRVEDDIHPLDKEPSTSRKDASKWSDCKRKAAQNLGNKGPLKSQQTSTATGASKWSHYISQEEEEEDGSLYKPAYNSFMTEDDESLLGSGRNFEDMVGRWYNNAASETTMNEQRVEDDIHPDFQ